MKVIRYFPSGFLIGLSAYTTCLRLKVLRVVFGDSEISPGLWPDVRLIIALWLVFVGKFNR